MEYKKITARDIAGKGVVGQADTPLLSALEMQNKVEEVPRAVIIPHFNSLIDRLGERDSGVDAALSDRYTKQQTEDAINTKITQLGAGDMAKAVYDTDGDGVVDNAQKLAVARKIGGAAFDGTQDISLEQIGAISKTDGTALQPTLVWTLSDGGHVELRRGGSESAYSLYLVMKKGDGTQEIVPLVTSTTTGQAVNFVPKTGGIFTGEVRADSGPSVNARVRNIMVNSNAGTQVSTNYIYMRRK